jgi:nitroreductase
LRATRIFEDRPLPEAVLLQILKCATMAGSSGNTQPWEFVVVTQRDLKIALKGLVTRVLAEIDTRRSQRADELLDGSGRSVTGHAAAENMEKAAAIVLVFWNPERGIRFVGEYEKQADGTYLPGLLPIGGRGASIYPACQNMMLAAHALGVSSSLNTSFGFVEHEAKDLLGLPSMLFFECAVLLGYGAERLGRPRRRPLDEVVHFDGWGSDR